MDCIVHGVAKSWTRLSHFHFSLAICIFCINCSYNFPIYIWVVVLFIKFGGLFKCKYLFSLVNCSARMCAKSLQSCLTFYDPMDCSLLGSSVHATLQARMLEWVTIFLQRIFLTQGSNLLLLQLLHCGQILYH